MPGLLGRERELAVLSSLIDGVAAQGAAIVVSGDEGIGKSSLLRAAADYAGQAGLRMLSISGIEAEAHLALAGLHQLLRPVLERLESVSAHHGEALRTAFGMNAGPPPDRFIIGVAVLSLLSEVAAERPLVCLIDDEQWLDRTSAQILAFAARRLGAARVVLIFATRAPGSELAGMPELVLRELPEADARTLLDSALPGAIDGRVRDQIVSEAEGHPLALLELLRGMSPAELAGGFGFPGAVPTSRGSQECFRRMACVLPPQTRRLLSLAAADPTGDPALLWRAATRLGLDASVALPAADAGIAEFGTRVRFRHPLTRSAAYRSASAGERQEAHRTLAEVTDPWLDPDRRAWHRAQGAAGPEEEIAAELERSADRARARGGLAAAAAFLEQAVVLSPDSARRAGRALSAAKAKVAAGSLNGAHDLLAVAETGPLGETDRARADLVRAWLAFATGRGAEAPSLMLAAARRMEPGTHCGHARDAYLDALAAAIFAGRLAHHGGDVKAVARAAGATPSPRVPRATDLLLDGLAVRVNHGYAAGAPILRSILSAVTSGLTAEQEIRWLSLASTAALDLWDADRWSLLTSRYVQRVRDVGAMRELPSALSSRVFTLVVAGELTAAASLAEEQRAAAEATGNRISDYSAVAVAALGGSEAEACAQNEAVLRNAASTGEGIGMTVVEWASAVLGNSLGHYGKALAAAERATENPCELAFPNWALPEMVEAAARSGRQAKAAAAYRRLAQRATASGTDWSQGIQARSGALLSEGAAAERLYHVAIDRLSAPQLRVELARAHLLYGEWLRRQRRRSESREQLRTARDMFEAMGAAAFAGRARQELRAAGDTVRSRTPAAVDKGLTEQEALIARLASEGLSNPEIGARLFISGHTVRYHLSKVFTKLGITSRSQLSRVLQSATAA